MIYETLAIVNGYCVYKIIEAISVEDVVEKLENEYGKDSVVPYKIDLVG